MEEEELGKYKLCKNIHMYPPNFIFCAKAKRPNSHTTKTYQLRKVATHSDQVKKAITGLRHKVHLKHHTNKAGANVDHHEHYTLR